MHTYGKTSTLTKINKTKQNKKKQIHQIKKIN